MIDVTEALASLVADFECTLERLRDEAETAQAEIEATREDEPPVPITFGSSYDQAEDEFWPPRFVRPANELHPPTNIRVQESGFDEDEMFRWQRWRR